MNGIADGGITTAPTVCPTALRESSNLRLRLPAGNVRAVVLRLRYQHDH